MSTLVCVPITVRDAEAAAREATRARDAGADIVEFRIDEFFTGEEASSEYQTRQIAALISECPLPCIVTCRVASEGGGYEGDEEARALLFERLATPPAGTHPPKYIDCEVASYMRSEPLREILNVAVGEERPEGELKSSLILSMHDFETRPPDLTRRLLEMQWQHASSVIKVALRARSLRDSLELLDLPGAMGKPAIALGMGEFGLISRVLAPKFGAFLTFAALRPAAVTAPGQPTVKELLELYRFRSIKRSTAVYGVVGWPVGHSLSPLVHNAGFDEVGHDGVYLPLPIAAGEGKNAEGSFESFKGTLLELIEHPRLNFRGASVTIPHKENLARLARDMKWEADDLTACAGAANTLVIDRAQDGSAARVRVMNTDARAAATSLEEVLGTIAERSFLVIGAGGVAKAIVAALALLGAKTTVASRSLQRAEEMLRALQTSPIDRGDGTTEMHFCPAAPATFCELERVGEQRYDAVINCTPVGMTGGPDPSGVSVDLRKLKPRSPELIVMDTVYSPVRTPLLEEAESLGMRTIDGVGMFVRQAAAQFEVWTGKRAPVAKFEALVRGALAERQAARP